MGANVALQPVNEQGWRNGLANLWRRESVLWWGKLHWLWQCLIWLLLIDGLFTVALLGVRSHPGSVIQPGLPMSDGCILLLSVFTMLLTQIGTVVIAHGKTISERQDGTAAWILSKPVSRSALILAKCAALPGMLLTMVLLTSVIGYGDIFLLFGLAVPFIKILLLIGTISCRIIFFFSLMLLLGTLLRSRALIIGIGLLMILVANQTIDRPNAAWIVGAQSLFSLLLMIGLLIGTSICLWLAIQRSEYEEF